MGKTIYIYCIYILKKINSILDRKKVGGQCVFDENGTNSPPPYRQHEHIRKCFVYGGGVMPARRAGSGVGICTLPRAQNRAAKSSTEK